MWDGNKWNSLGEAWSENFSAGFDANCEHLVFDSEKKLYACGSFDVAGGISCKKIAMWDGKLWNSLEGGLDDTCNVIVFDHYDNLYAGGNFLNHYTFSQTISSKNFVKANKIKDINLIVDKKISKKIVKNGYVSIFKNKSSMLYFTNN